MNNIYFYLSKFIAPLLNPTNLLFIVAIVLFLIFFYSKNKLVLIFLKVNIIILIFIALTPVGKFGLKYLEKDFINQIDSENIKNIIVLSGSEDLVSTMKTNKVNLSEASERLIASIKLANKFKNSVIYYVGGNGYISKNNLSEIAVAKKFYLDVNFDLEKINFIGNTRNTIENISEIKKLKIDDSTSILITSAFHMKRTMMISEKLQLKFIPYAVDFRSISNKSLLNRYQKYSISSNLSNFDLFIREIIGILAFKIMI